MRNKSSENVYKNCFYYYGLTDSRMSAFDTDLPIQQTKPLYPHSMGQWGILGKPACGYGEEKEPESQIKQTKFDQYFHLHVWVFGKCDIP